MSRALRNVTGCREALARLPKLGLRELRQQWRVLARLWEPWIAWAYGARFDRRTEEHIPEAGLELIEARFVVDDLVRLMSARAPS